VVSSEVVGAPSRSPGLAGPLVRAAGWFIPPAVVARGRAAQIQAQAILAVVVAGALVGSLFAALDLRFGAPPIGLATLAWVVVGCAVPFVLRRSGSLELAGNLLVGTAFLLILTPGLLTLGRGPGVVFLFLVPVVAVLFCSRRAALCWTLLAIAATVGLDALAQSSLAAPVALPPGAPAARLHRVGLAAILVSGACILTYDAMKATALREAERANAALRESREQYRDLVETSPDAVLVTRGGRVVYANPRAVAMLGASSRADLIGVPSERVTRGPPDRITELRDAIAAGTPVTNLRTHLQTLAGEPFPVEISASTIRYEGQPAILSVIRDRREEERTLERLRLLGAVVEQADEGVLVVDARGVVQFANEAYARVRGLPVAEIVGRRVHELPRDPAGREFLRKLRGRLGHGSFGRRFAFDTPSGRTSWDIRVFPIDTGDGRGPSALTLLRDVTHEVELEERARQSQKMEAVGQLAGGIAHDFNNLLTVILGHAEELRAALPAGAAVLDEVGAILDAAERSATLTQQLLAFARRQALDVGVLEPNRVVRGMRDMLRRLLPECIDLEVELAPDTPPILADRGQLEQVILNLALNARDAIEGAGRIRVTTSAGPLAEGLRGPGAADRRHAILRVDDDGGGMDEAVQGRIFEPFFTTKPLGRGTGLGLSTVHGIVYQSGGAIDVESKPGQGTVVSVYLPAVEGAEAAAEAAREPARVAEPVYGSVLLVEDEESVRRLGRRALEAAGFRVHEADGGEEALRLVRREPIDLVISDIVMPGMSGLELAEHIARLRPGVPVLFVSGYAEEHPESPRAPAGVRELLGKPFRPQQLVERVRQLLDARRPDRPPLAGA
jgi:PAS domain S-box-containing protein